MIPPPAREPDSSARAPDADAVRVLHAVEHGIEGAGGGSRARDGSWSAGASGLEQSVLVIEPRKGLLAALRIARARPEPDVVHAHGPRALRWARVGLALAGGSAALVWGPGGRGGGIHGAEVRDVVYRDVLRSRLLRLRYRARLERRGRVGRALRIDWIEGPSESGEGPS